MTCGLIVTWPCIGQLRAVALADLGKEAQEVRLVVCISLEQILPRPQAGLLSRMLRLADVPLVKGGLLHFSGIAHSPVKCRVLHPLTYISSCVRWAAGLH